MEILVLFNLFTKSTTFYKIVNRVVNMNNIEIFSKRLKNARIMKGLSMDSLVKAMGNSVSKMTISKYENCKLSPSSTVLIELSKALEMPIDYFFRPFTQKIDSIKFRKNNSNLSVKVENSIKESVFDFIERYRYIEEICDSSVTFDYALKSLVSKDEDVIEAAYSLREIWNIGEDGIVNVIELLEERGVKVLEMDLPNSLDGLSAVVNEIYPVVILNVKMPSERKRFTALHELGHLILTFASSVLEKEEERFCNIFASEMLIPDAVFKIKLGTSRHDISYLELWAIQVQYGISPDALMYKAKSSGIINEERYRSFCIQKNRNERFKDIIEQSLYPKEKSYRFQSLVYKALSNELISISKAATLLSQSVEQVRENFILI